MDETEVRLPALDGRATANVNMISDLDTRIQGTESEIASADVRSAKVTENVSKATTLA